MPELKAIVAALAFVAVMPARATEVYVCETEHDPDKPPLYDKITINPDDGTVTAISAMTSPPVEGEEPAGGTHHNYQVLAGSLKLLKLAGEDVDKFGVQHPNTVTIIGQVGWRTYDGGAATLWNGAQMSRNAAALVKTKASRPYKCPLTQSDLWTSTAKH
jgi:hypothetical protein